MLCLIRSPSNHRYLLESVPEESPSVPGADRASHMGRRDELLRQCHQLRPRSRWHEEGVGYVSESVYVVSSYRKTRTDTMTESRHSIQSTFLDRSVLVRQNTCSRQRTPYPRTLSPFNAACLSGPLTFGFIKTQSACWGGFSNKTDGATPSWMTCSRSETTLFVRALSRPSPSRPQPTIFRPRKAEYSLGLSEGLPVWP